MDHGSRLRSPGAVQLTEPLLQLSQRNVDRSRQVAASYSSGGRTSSTVTSPFPDQLQQVRRGNRLQTVFHLQIVIDQAVNVSQMALGHFSQRTEQCCNIRPAQLVEDLLTLLSVGNQTRLAKLLQVLRGVCNSQAETCDSASTLRSP